MRIPGRQHTMGSMSPEAELQDAYDTLTSVTSPAKDDDGPAAQPGPELLVLRSQARAGARCESLRAERRVGLHPRRPMDASTGQA